MLRTCREFLRECDELKLPEPTFLDGEVQKSKEHKILHSISEGVAVITDETYGQLMETFDNVEQEEFFEVSTFLK